MVFLPRRYHSLHCFIIINLGSSICEDVKTLVCFIAANNSLSLMTHHKPSIGIQNIGLLSLSAMLVIDIDYKVSCKLLLQQYYYVRKPNIDCCKIYNSIAILETGGGTFLMSIASRTNLHQHQILQTRHFASAIVSLVRSKANVVCIINLFPCCVYQ